MARLRLIQHKLYMLWVEHKKLNPALDHAHRNCLNVSVQLCEQG